MTDHAALHAAVRSVVDRLDCCDRDALTDGIMAAILPVLDDGVTVEWSVQRHDGRVVNAMSEGEARACVTFGPTSPLKLTLVSRRVGPWEAVPS